MKQVVETLINRGEKSRENLLAVNLLRLVEKEITEIRGSKNYLEIGETLLELSVLIKLKSELLLLLFSITNFKRERSIEEETEILDIFSVIKNSFKTEEEKINRAYVETEEENEVPISKLSKIVKEILEREKYIETKTVSRNAYSIRDAMQEIEKLLKEKNRIVFQDFFAEKHSKIEIVLMFLAILIMAKNGKILIRQDDLFSPIYVIKNEKRRVQSGD